MMKMRRMFSLIFMMSLIGLAVAPAAFATSSDVWYSEGFLAGTEAGTATMTLVLNPNESSSAACGFSSQIVVPSTYPGNVGHFTNNRYPITTVDANASDSTSTQADLQPSSSSPLYMYWTILSTTAVEVNIYLDGPLKPTKTTNSMVVPVTVSWTYPTGGTAKSLSASVATDSASANVASFTTSDTDLIINDFTCVALSVSVDPNDTIENYYYLPEDAYYATLSLEVKTT